MLIKLINLIVKIVIILRLLIMTTMNVCSDSVKIRGQSQTKKYATRYQQIRKNFGLIC